MTRILMIEDDCELAEILSDFLQSNDMEVEIALDPYLGLSSLKTSKFDLLILDLTLPGIDGLDICKEVRTFSNVPIIVSSARTDLSDKIIALDNGADDYIPKPYDPQELLARIRSNLRRFTSSDVKDKKEEKDLEVDDFQRIIYFKKKPLTLTPAEYDVLKYLISKHRGVVSREELIYSCDSINEDSSNKSIDVIINRIRAKINDNSKDPRYIHAIRGVGYKITL